MGLGSFFLLRRFVFWRPRWRLAFFLPLILFSLLLLVGSVANVVAMANYRHAPWNRPILSATDFLNKESPAWGNLISQLNEKIHTPLGLLEPYGTTYDFDSNKVSIYTGLPSYLVWAGQHVNQRGLSWPLIDKRKKEIDDIYKGTNDDKLCPFLKEQNLSFIVWQSGELTQPCLKLWYDSGNVKLYQRQE